MPSFICTPFINTKAWLLSVPLKKVDACLANATIWCCFDTFKPLTELWKSQTVLDAPLDD